MTLRDRTNIRWSFLLGASFVLMLAAISSQFKPIPAAPWPIFLIGAWAMVAAISRLIQNTR